MILGSNLGRPRETPKLEWRCPGLEVEFKTHSCNIYSAFDVPRWGNILCWRNSSGHLLSATLIFDS